ncbi:sirohydrochlorin cobaltochelatase [Carboxylicivirga sp. A043]|uniref:sirohydrochlorin cobaltochelatase n=1 Tax=Carboxylicivirga litoralis TaxID=2816963 RepID=UPI0021CB7A21|nr:sirohydrochlorin cobaltochelatase [Carboxylicivirga sp. A043]MCU4155117.1 sirohydrochlorin cobaltochelatase [Carboxylicivirga sp. A043]
MNLFKKAAWALMATTVMFTACSDDDDNSEFKLGDKEGNLLVTFGSSFPEPQLTFQKIDETAKKEFKNEEIRWGYTSDLILNKLRQGNGEGSLNGTVIDNDTPQEALEVMVKEGYSTFYVQSLHVIPGEEFEELNEAIEAFEHKYEGVKVKVGTPLLTSDADIKAVAKVLADKFATQVAEGPVLFMGHGTPHQADGQYTKLQAELTALNPNFFVGTVEGIGFGKEENEGKGPLAIGSLVAKVNAITPKPTKVTITPLMSIAGDHANNDMNGITGKTDPIEQSWRERLEAEGYEVTDIMKGLGDYEEINAIWMNHLKAIK